LSLNKDFVAASSENATRGGVKPSPAHASEFFTQGYTVFPQREQEALLRETRPDEFTPAPRPVVVRARRRGCPT
jgi:hypothetical protein